MATWIATFSNDLNEDAPIKELEVEATSDLEALETLDSKDYPTDEWRGYSLLNIKKKRGGHRPGAGRPKGQARAGTYGCGVKTKPVRVPEAIAPKLPEMIESLEELGELLNDWEAEAEKSTSPRYDRARKLIQEIRALGF